MPSDEGNTLMLSKRAAGKGEIAALWRAERAEPALPEQH